MIPRVLPFETVLRLIAALRRSGRVPTPEERAAVASFPGWGERDTRDRFDPRGRPIGAVGLLVKSRDELSAAAAFSPPPVPEALADLMWAEAARRCPTKLSGARVLDPCAGPAAVSRRAPPCGRLILAEPAPFSREAAEILSPPGAQVVASAGFLGEGSVDAVVGAAPAEAVARPDKTVKPAYLLDAPEWFASRAVLRLRPGGVAVLLVPSSLLDAPDQRARAWLSARADLEAAARFPEGEVADGESWDLIVFRRRPGRAGADRSWLAVEEGPGGCALPAFYARHPAAAVGRWGPGPWGRPRLFRHRSGDACSAAASVLATFPAPPPQPAGEGRKTKPADLAEALALDLASATSAALRDQAAGLDPEPGLEKARKARATLLAVVGDLKARALDGLASAPEWALVSAAAQPDALAAPSVRGPRQPDGTPEGALASALDAGGRPPSMSELARSAGISEEAAEAALSGKVFRDPEGGGWREASEYLSGDVPSRLAEAEALAASDPAFAPNVAALRAALPEASAAARFPMGATWIPEVVVKDFALRLTGTRAGVDVRLTRELASWTCRGTSSTALRAVGNVTTWGCPGMSGLEILEDGLNLRPPIVLDEDEEGRRFRDDEETAAAAGKLEAIREEWDGWLLSDPSRAASLKAEWARRFASLVPRKYSGEHLSFPGLAIRVNGEPFEPRPAQRAAAERIAADTSPDNTFVIVHKVGRGKTFAALAGFVRRWQLGLSDRLFLVVPSGRVFAQWAAAFRTFYPGLADKLLAAPEGVAAPEEFLRRVAAGEAPFALMTYEQFRSTPLSPESFAARVEGPAADLEELVGGLTGEEGRVLERAAAVRRRAAAKAAEAHARLWDKLSAGGKSPLTWETLAGPPERLILAFDEWQALKAIPVQTKVERVAGMPRGDSLRAADALAKVDWLLDGGGRAGALTGTPVTNTLAETWIAMRFFQRRLLARTCGPLFDDWASTFCEPITSVEMDPVGKYRPVVRFRFQNLPELLSLLAHSWDFARPEADDGPRMVGGEPEIVEVEGSDALAAFVRDLARRAEAVRAGLVDRRDDNMLKITSEGRAAAVRNGPPGAPIPEAGTKLDALADKAWWAYSRYHDLKGTQAVFCDVGVPKAGGVEGMTEGESAEAETVYDEVRKRVQARGVLGREVVFVHEAKTPRQTEALFRDFNDGRIRVLLGSTPKLGVGTNPQRRLVGLHHLDCPWRPDGFIQRNGRGLRPQNLWDLVHVWVYVTRRSYDVCLWQLVQVKADFVSKLQEGEAACRSADDVGELVITAAMAKAVALGDERVLRKIRAEAALSNLERRRRSWRAGVDAASKDLEGSPARLGRLLEELRAVRAAADLADFSPSLRDARSPDPRKCRDLDHADAVLRGLAEAFRPLLRRPIRIGEVAGKELRLESRYGGAALVMDLSGAEVVIHGAGPGAFAALRREVGLLDIRASALEKAAEAEEARSAALSAEVSRPWPAAREAARLLIAYESLCSELATDGLVDRKTFDL